MIVSKFIVLFYDEASWQSDRMCLNVMNMNCYIYKQLYARRHFLFPPLSIDVYNERVMSIVRCEAQVCKWEQTDNSHK